MLQLIDHERHQYTLGSAATPAPGRGGQPSQALTALKHMVYEHPVRNLEFSG